MSWIDIFLADGDPQKVYGADAKEALAKMQRLKDLPFLWGSYRRLGLPMRDQLTFLGLDIIRSLSYRRGFCDGKRFPWPEEPR
jgi:hypothetical protein